MGEDEAAIRQLVDTWLAASGADDLDTARAGDRMARKSVVHLRSGRFRILVHGAAVVSAMVLRP